MSANSEDARRRDQVLGQVRRSLGVRGDEAARKAIVRGRLENHPRGTIPKRGQPGHFNQVRKFIAMAEAADATTKRVKNKGEALAAITDFLRRQNLPAKLVHGADPYIKSLGWRASNAPETREGRAEPDDLVSLAKAFGGVAETGTLVMLSGPENPVTLNFLPFTEIVLIEAKDILGNYESVWDRLREDKGVGIMPRTVNWITGPSRSADIGQELLLGAHGPGDLHIIVVG